MKGHVDHVLAKPQMDKEKTNLVVETSKTRQQESIQGKLVIQSSGAAAMKCHIGVCPH